MGFSTYGASKSEASKKEVDFDKLNEYLVEACGLQDRETVVGTISSIVDLGTQELPDAEVIFNGDQAEMDKIIAEKPDTYFEEGYDYQSKKTVMYKKWPQPPRQCIAISLDVNDIIVDKAQWFGESKPLPLRVYLGGTFYIPNVGMVVQRPTPLKVNKKLGDWSLDQKHLCYQMAVGAKIIKPGQVFPPDQIDKLLGKSLQFAVQIYFKEGKDGKRYFQEYASFVGGLGRGMVAPTSDVEPALIQFNEDNKDADIQALRNHVVNTIKRASNYEGSKIQAQIERVKGASKQKEQESEGDDTPDEEPVKEVKTPAKAPKAKVTKPAKVDDPFDDDDSIPF